MAIDKGDLRADLERVRADLQGLREDFNKATESLYHAGRRSVNAARQQAREGADATTAYVRDTVNQRPLTALLVAACVGVLMGALFRRD